MPTWVKVLQQKVKKLKRPVKVTFSRNHAHASYESGRSFDADTFLNTTGSTKFSISSRISSIDEDRALEQDNLAVVDPDIEKDNDDFNDNASLKLSLARARLMRARTSDSEQKTSDENNGMMMKNEDNALLERGNSTDNDINSQSFNKFKDEK